MSQIGEERSETIVERSNCREPRRRVSRCITRDTRFKEQSNRGHPLTGGEGLRVEGELEQRNDRRINRSTHCAARRSRVYTCRRARGGVVCVNWSHARPTFTVNTRTRAAGSVPIMGMQVAKQVPFIHVRRALVVYHLQFPIYHLPSSSSERVSTTAIRSLSLSLSFAFSLSLRGFAEVRRKERERERKDERELVTNGYTRERSACWASRQCSTRCVTPDADGPEFRVARIASASCKWAGTVRPVRRNAAFYDKAFPAQPSEVSLRLIQLEIKFFDLSLTRRLCQVLFYREIHFNWNRVKSASYSLSFNLF